MTNGARMTVLWTRSNIRGLWTNPVPDPMAVRGLPGAAPHGVSDGEARRGPVVDGDRPVPKAVDGPVQRRRHGGFVGLWSTMTVALSVPQTRSLTKSTARSRNVAASGASIGVSLVMLQNASMR